jgi:hypothetical protein
MDKYAGARLSLQAAKVAAVAARAVANRITRPVDGQVGDADLCLRPDLRYPDVIRPALQIHHTTGTAHRAAGVYIMIVEDRVYLFTDATVNIDPTAEDLAEIACLAADFAKKLELDPRVAFLSFSNFGSTPHPLSDKVRKAVEIVKTRCPGLPVDGEMQADTAVVPEIVDERYPFSAVKDANVLVFPSLESANIAYKLLARLGGAKAIGPILPGWVPGPALQTATMMPCPGGLGRRHGRDEPRLENHFSKKAEKAPEIISGVFFNSDWVMEGKKLLLPFKLKVANVNRIPLLDACLAQSFIHAEFLH